MDRETFTPKLQAPVIERHRHELIRRSLTVVGTAYVTPAMLRITFRYDGPANFISLAPDDHIKIFLDDGNGGVQSRDYTPRSHDASMQTVAIDFAIHDAGPATKWALSAQTGDTLSVGGPRGSAVISSVSRWLLIGDETALPAIGRRIEEAGPDTTITAIITVANEAERQSFETVAKLNVHWIYRPLDEASDPAPVLSVLSTLDLPKDTFAWVAAEAKVARAVKAFLMEEKGHPPIWLKAAGYWLMGHADSHEKLD